ncbi:MAG: amidohydrolase family protein [Nitrososphaerota archaeon]
MYSLVLRNCMLQEIGRLVDIGISDGVISDIGTVDKEGSTSIDVEGRLVLMSFVIPHLHLCKVYTLDLVGSEAVALYRRGKMENSARAIEFASRLKERYREDWIYVNARRALYECFSHGATHVRAFADVDSRAGLEAVKALLRLRDECADDVCLQVVAFPQEGLIREPESQELLYRAIEMGCDVVGGIPWIEDTERDMRRHVQIVFDIAVSHGKDVSMLTDDAGDPTLRTTEMLCQETLKRGWMGRVSACHARALALYSRRRLHTVVNILKKAGVSLVVSPHTGRVWAPVRDMLEGGVNVALGQDDINDAYYPFGRGKMLEVAFLAAHLLDMMTPEDAELLIRMITENAARSIGVEGHVLRVGSPANLVVLPCRTAFEAVWTQPEPLYIIKRGEVRPDMGE